MGFRVVDRMIQLLGATGVARELPLEGWLRDLRVARLVEGSSEMLRSQIARQVIGPAVRLSGGDHPRRPLVSEPVPAPGPARPVRRGITPRRAVKTPASDPNGPIGCTQGRARA